MTYDSSLYSKFQEVVAENNAWGLDPFTDPSFLDQLNEEDQLKFAHLFLKRAFQLLTTEIGVGSEEVEKLFVESIDYIERFLPHNCATCCLTAKLLFHFGKLRQKSRFFLFALDRMNQAEESDLKVFEKSFECWHLWGNILTSIARFIEDGSFLESALQKYEKAAQNLALYSSKRGSIDLFKDESDSQSSTSILDEFENEYNAIFGQFCSVQQLYWDWAEAWKLLGQQSGEVVDFTNAISKFMEASQFEPTSAFFHVDFGEALVALGMLTGEAKYLEEALELFKAVIAKSSIHPIPAKAYSEVWKFYATTQSKLFFLTHDDEHFEKADKVFKEALVAVPHLADLWLDWGALFLHAGKMRQGLKEIETALDKFTSTKVQECDPLHLSALLGEGVILLGLFLEDFKFLKEGKDRIFTALMSAPENGKLLYAAGMAHLCHGLYFSDPQEFRKAITYFEKKIELGQGEVGDWYGIFEAYLGWGLIKKENGFLMKALQGIERVSKLRPQSPFYLDEWGLALLRLWQIDKETLFPIEKAVEKFQEALQIEEDPETLYHYGCALDMMGDMTGYEEDYERAIDALSQAVDAFPSAHDIRYHLAIAISHYGELTANIESLNFAVELLESISQIESEDDRIWCELGYALLNLSVLIEDPAFPDREKELRIRSETHLVRAIELGNREANYHLACLYSLEGMYHPSIHYLKRAENVDTLPSIEDLEHDEWLEGIRTTDAFQEFLITRKQF